MEALVISLIPYAIKYGPEAAAAIVEIFSKKDATAQDWANAFRSGTTNARKLLAEPEPT